MEEGAMSAAAGDAGKQKSPLSPQPQPSVGASLADANQGASYSAPRPSCPATASGSSRPPKPKRGRPRKYTPDGTVLPATLPAPYPIAVAAPPTPSLSWGFPLALGGLGVVMPWAPQGLLPSPLAPPPSANSTQQANEMRVWRPSSQQVAVAEPGVTGLIPQIITVQGGEDVAAEVMSYAGNGWAVCILSAIGVICNVTMHQAASSGETVIYEGRFDILSLSGFYLLPKTNELSTQKGGFSISFAGLVGRVFSGRLAGPLIAASPVQVLIGRFPANEQREVNQSVASGTPGASSFTPSGAPNGSSSGSGLPRN